MIVPVGELGNEVGPGSSDGPRLFERDGYVVARGALPREAIEAIRHEAIARLGESGIFSPDQSDPDAVRWSGRYEDVDPALSGAERALAQKQLLAGFADTLLDSGLLEPLLERLWGRSPRISRAAMLTLVPPGADVDGSPHRDIGPGGPGHVRLWIPLVRIGRGGGGLALALGSHRLSLRELPVPSAEAFAGSWHETTFAVGDALLFRPDIVHGSTPNTSGHVRMALPLFATDRRLPSTPGAELSDVERTRGVLEFGPVFNHYMGELGASSNEIRFLLPWAWWGRSRPPTKDECSTQLSALRSFSEQASTEGTTK